MQKGDSHKKAGELTGSFAFTWLKHDQAISWEIEGQSLKFDSPENLSKLNLEQRVNLFNQILATYRQRAKIRDDFKTAAIGITEDGNYYLGHNIDIVDPFHKGCAEDNMIRAMLQVEGSDTKIETLYLMAGKSNPGAGTSPKELELPSLPCGVCTDTLARCTTEGATLIALPPNDGSLRIKVNSTAQSEDELQPGEAWYTSIKTLMVNSEIHLKGKAKKVSHEAWRDLIKGTLEIEPVELNNASSLSEINRFMAREIIETYKKRSPTVGGFHNAEKVRCVVVRLADGGFGYATDSMGPEDNSAPHAEATAVATVKALNQRITDMWVMEMDAEDIAQGKLHTSSKEGLERVYKRRPLAEHKATDHSGNDIVENVKVHYLPFNSGNLRDEQVEKIKLSFDIADLFASRFKGSMYIGGNGNGAKGSVRH